MPDDEQAMLYKANDDVNIKTLIKKYDKYMDSGSEEEDMEQAKNK